MNLEKKPIKLYQIKVLLTYEVEAEDSDEAMADYYNGECTDEEIIDCEVLS